MTAGDLFLLSEIAWRAGRIRACWALDEAACQAASPCWRCGSVQWVADRDRNELVCAFCGRDRRPVDARAWEVLS